MEVTPLHLEMTASGGRGQVTVRNHGATPLPVETSIQGLSVDENGENTLKEAGEEFLVFPQQALIPPGGTQVFRIQWVGEPLLAESQSFVVSFDQIPVKMQQKNDEIGAQMVASFGVIVNVAPPQGRPGLKVVATGVATGKDGKRHPQVTFENASKTHALLSQANIEIVSGGWSASMSAFEIRNKLGLGLVQPGKRRKLALPFDLPAGVSRYEVKVDLDPKRR